MSRARHNITVAPNIDPIDEELDHKVMEALHKSQPGPFRGEGKNLGEVVGTWIESMDDYFDVAGYIMKGVGWPLHD